MFLMVMPDLTSPEVWISVLTLTFLEIVLGIDNIIFISILAGRLPEDKRKLATNLGLLMAMLQRILLLFGVSALTAMNAEYFHFDIGWLKGGLTGQNTILLAGGIFLLYKSTTEIHHKLEGDGHEGNGKKAVASFSSAIAQILLIDLVFSVDSILTAVGMTSGIEGALVIMIFAVVVAVLIMMLFAVPVGRFVNKHPTIQMLGLAFLILIGFMLIAEGAHLGHLELFGQSIGAVPKGYLYFAIAFSLGVEFLNMRLRKKKSPVQLHGISEDAVDEGIIDK